LFFLPFKGRVGVGKGRRCIKLNPSLSLPPARRGRSISIDTVLRALLPPLAREDGLAFFRLYQRHDIRPELLAKAAPLRIDSA
jgi:hypothetical protein